MKIIEMRSQANPAVERHHQRLHIVLHIVFVAGKMCACVCVFVRAMRAFISYLLWESVTDSETKQSAISM